MPKGQSVCQVVFVDIEALGYTHASNATPHTKPSTQNMHKQPHNYSPTDHATIWFSCPRVKLCAKSCSSILKHLGIHMLRMQPHTRSQPSTQHKHKQLHSHTTAEPQSHRATHTKPPSYNLGFLPKGQIACQLVLVDLEALGDDSRLFIAKLFHPEQSCALPV